MPQDGSTAADAAGITLPALGHQSNEFDSFSPMNATADLDRDDGLPDTARYEGPQVADQVPWVNPSVGNQGPTDVGTFVDVNPQGAIPAPGSEGPVDLVTVRPDTTQGNPR